MTYNYQKHVVLSILLTKNRDATLKSVANFDSTYNGTNNMETQNNCVSLLIFTAMLS
jgi:hypothetical protein